MVPTFLVSFFRYFWTVVRLLKCYLVTVLRSWDWLLGLAPGSGSWVWVLGLQPKRCSYCLALGAGEGVCQMGKKVWVCKTCR